MSSKDGAPTRRAFLAGTGAAIGATAATASTARPQGETHGAGGIDGRRTDEGDDFTPALKRAYRTAASPPVSPPGRPGWGMDVINLPRGSLRLRTRVEWGGSLLGFGMVGRANYASTLAVDIDQGAAIPLQTYVGVRFQDFFLRNLSPRAGTSVAFDLTGTGGGAELTIKRVLIEGFDTAIRVNGERSNPGNCDKTLVEQVQFHTNTGFDNTRNKQAIGWTFLNCASGCGETVFRLGGAGEVAVLNHVGDIYGSLIQLPEGSGNAGSGNYVGCRATVMSSKLEYHGQGARMLLDARASLLPTDGGGSNADIVFRDVSIASGPAQPDPATHVVMQVGDGRRGADAVRVRQDGGWVEGVIRHASAHPGPNNRRWSFHDAIRAPDPARVRLEGAGNHPLMEWRRNENVPVDQYRGGEAFTGSIDAQKAFLWRHDGRTLINTGIANADHGGRRGAQFTIGGFPPRMTVTGLAVFINENRAGTDTLVEWFADRGFAVPVARALIAGNRRGLQAVVMNDPGKWQTLSAGELYVRITKPMAGDSGTEGALVLFYFPYMGA
ncbi:MAG TPA: hypothetical protein VF592_12270 [Sphingomonas sp.]|jgi:hypothetical protein|uniref:hypothetical protein n=1 Tax=Sphingomonas sp. TaxID=28214 RepID=UPI002ED9D5CB